MNLSEPFIRRPVATSLMMAALAFMGLTAFPFLPVAPLPQVDFPTIQVTATLAGGSAETMASSVAAPLERQFGQIAGVTQLTSLSALGVTQVVIQFDLNRNIDSASQDVQAAITAASKFLPQAMTQPPNYRKVNPADAPILMLRAYSETLPLTTVHDYLDNFFIQSLSQVPGVAQAGIIGDQKPSIRVQIDPAKLAAIGLTLEEVRAKLVTATANAPKGAIYTSQVGFTITANDQISTAEEFNDVVLAYRDNGVSRARRRRGCPCRNQPLRSGLSEQQTRHSAEYQEAGRGQRHRHGRAHPAATPTPYGQHPGGHEGRDAPRSYGHHPRFGARDRIHADIDHRAGHSGSAAVLAQLLGDVHPGPHGSARVARLVRHHVLA
jgi:hypothetical protein